MSILSGLQKGLQAMAKGIFILYARNERLYPVYYPDQQLHNIYMNNNNNNNNNILYIVSTEYG